MSALKILIVEDEQVIADSLQEILDELGYQIVGQASSAEEALALLANSSPDLVLLDIQIKGEVDGVDLAENIRKTYDIPYIFTTAFADEATISRAKETSPFGYIIKPYGIKDIYAAIEIALNNHQLLKDSDVTNSSPEDHDTLFIKVDSRLVRLHENEILWVEAKGDYAVFKTESKSYIVHSTMRNIEDKLNPRKFLKVHRSYIINLDKIVDIEDSNVLIKDNIIPVSRSNKIALINRLHLL